MLPRSCKTLVEGSKQADAQAYSNRSPSTLDVDSVSDLWDGILYGIGSPSSSLCFALAPSFFASLPLLPSPSLSPSISRSLSLSLLSLVLISRPLVVIIVCA